MALHAVTLVFEDGRAVRIQARDDETVYAAALRQNVRIATDCLEGACATCKAFCTAGTFALGDYSEQALSDDERAQGYTLCCQARPRSDGVIEFAYASQQALARVPAATYPLRVQRVERVSPSVVRLDLERRIDAPLGFLPGQYVHLRVPGTPALRSYSMANAPEQTEVLSFYVKLLAGGAMSDYAASRAQPGDAIDAIGPFGHFYLRAPVRPIVMVAGGTGLAPMLSMLEHLAQRGGCAHPIHLLYGVNTPDEFFGQEQLAALAGRGLALDVERIPVEAAPGWSGPAGHVTVLLREALIAGGDCDAYLCGPPAMVEAAQTWLAQHGVARQRVHTEKFVAS
jgi:benzoate/toluate 1,2-dioxygenase reductase subunit